jgi:uncharacterized membrane protein YoaK (UPF0700 family)
MTTVAEATRPSLRATTVGLPTVLIAMTSLTGLVDAISYLGLGHVLVANMTGNVVFLGFALAGTAGFSVTASVVALGGFLLGAAAGGRLASSASDRRHWLTATVAIESVLALLAAIGVATGALSAAGPTRFAVIVLLAVGLGVQNATVRKLAMPDLTTTVLTMTLTGLAADSRAGAGGDPRVGRRAGSALTMLLGAVAGAALVRTAGLTAALAVLAGLYAVIAAGFAVQRNGESA